MKYRIVISEYSNRKEYLPQVYRCFLFGWESLSWYPISGSKRWLATKEEAELIIEKDKSSREVARRKIIEIK